MLTNLYAVHVHACIEKVAVVGSNGLNYRNGCTKNTILGNDKISLAAYVNNIYIADCKEKKGPSSIYNCTKNLT